MAVSLVLEGQILARKVLIYQSILAMIVALFFAVVFGENSGLSAGYGALPSNMPVLVKIS